MKGTIHVNNNLGFQGLLKGREGMKEYLGVLRYPSFSLLFLL